MELNKQFEEWLMQTPEALSKFLDVIKAWYDNQGKPIPVGDPPDAGPDEFEFGGKPELKTVGLTHEDLDALTQGYAEAHVKEKAIAWIKGFIAGVSIMA
jgi:hypothetical protein